MKKVKITVMRKVRHDDLIEKYENPLEHECTVEEGEVFIANGWVKPDDFCDRSAMISCNDGFRPVSFLLETMDEDAD